MGAQARTPPPGKPSTTIDPPEGPAPATPPSLEADKSLAKLLDGKATTAVERERARTLSALFPGNQR